MAPGTGLFIHHLDVESLPQGNVQLQAIDGIQAQALHEKRLIVTDLLRLNILQRQGLDDESLDLQRSDFQTHGLPC